MSEYNTVCDKCYRPTWYETEQPCKRSISHGCETCGSHEYVSDTTPCIGTLRVIDKSNLPNKFAHYHENGQRIEVKTPYGETIRGYVGKTTGWKPSYILLARSNSMGSSELLNSEYEITKTINRYR